MDRCFGLRFTNVRALIGGKASVMSPNQWWFLGSGVFPWVEVLAVCHIDLGDNRFPDRAYAQF